MIRFRSQTLLIYDPASQTERPLDQEALQARLEQAFARHGNTDHILANTLLDTVVRHFDQAEYPPPRITRDELVELLAKLLGDLGHAEVAKTFRDLLDPAENAAHNTAQPIQQEPIPQLLQKTRYIAADGWELAASQELRLMFQKRVITLLPLSDLQRIVTIDCRPSRLYDLPDCPRTELELHLLLPQLAQQTAAVLKMMRQAVQRRWGMPPENVAHVHVLEMNALVQVSCPSRTQKARQAFGEQLRSELEAALRMASETPLLIDFSE